MYKYVVSFILKRNKKEKKWYLVIKLFFYYSNEKKKICIKKCFFCYLVFDFNMMCMFCILFDIFK